MLVLLLILAAGAVPIGLAVLQRVALDQATAQTLRFATSAPDTPELGATDPAPGCRRPDDSQIAAEARSALQADGGGPLAALSVTPDPGAACSTNPPGTPVRLTLATTVSLGPAAGLLRAVGLPVPQTLTSTALGREE